MKNTFTFLFTFFTFWFYSQELVEYKNEENKIGFKNSAGQIVIPAKYDSANGFEDGLCKVAVNYKHGVIDVKGQIIIPIEFDYIFDFEKKLAIVGKDDKKGVYKSNGQIFLKPEYYEIILGKDLIYATILGLDYANYTLFDYYGKKIVFPKYDFIDFSPEKFIIVSSGGKRDIRGNYSGGKWFLHASNGKKISEQSYDFIERQELFGLYKICSGAPYNVFNGFESSKGKCGFMDSTGKMIIPLIYEDAKKFNEEMVAVKTNGKWGYINELGKVVIAATFSQADDFSEGLAPVSDGNLFGYVNKNGQIQIPFIYEFADVFRFGSAAVKKEGEYYKINIKGEKIE